MKQNWEFQRMEDQIGVLVLQIMDRISAVETEALRDKNLGGIARSRRRWGWVTVKGLVDSLLSRLEEWAQEELMAIGGTPSGGPQAETSLTPNLQPRPPEDWAETRREWAAMEARAQELAMAEGSPPEGTPQGTPSPQT